LGHEANNLTSLKNKILLLRSLIIDTSCIIVVKVQDKIIRTIISILLLRIYSVCTEQECLEQNFGKYRIDIAAIQEVSLRGSGVMDTGNLMLMCSGNGSNTFRFGFLINMEYKLTIMNFESADEKIHSLRTERKV
jgi:hypothetical protein